MWRFAVLLCGLLVTAAAAAGGGSKEILYGKVPDWTLPVPTPTDTPAPPGAPVRIQYQDFQVFAGPDGEEVFTAARLSILKPDGLAAGNVRLTWSPDAGDATVHYLRVLRDGKAINVLEASKFQILRREEDLENSALNGNLTAVLQVPGLRVGDDLEFAATVRRKDLTLGDHSSGFIQLPVVGMPGAFRIRFLWPASRHIIWRASKDMPQLHETSKGAYKEVEFDLRDPPASIETRGAPDRFNVRRLLEYTDFASWQEVSARVWPLFDNASVLPADSPVRQEVARIAADTKDPLHRAEAALQLVEQKIRYVYVGMDGGNMQPATVAETWSRRFGDCKAKTALLLAILRELGIEAEPVLVQSGGGDGLNELLPSPGRFDHVLVRARIGGASYWLDGTRMGDVSLAGLPPRIYRWVLPLRQGGAELESVALATARAPQLISVLDLDASGGFAVRVPMHAQTILRGDEAYALHAQLAAMAPADAERALRSLWERDDSSVEVDSATWRYDEQGMVLGMNVTGTTKVDWDGDDQQGRGMDIPGAGFSPPAEFRRPREQDQSAPWATDYPRYRCWATTIHLPPVTTKWKWDYRARTMYQEMGGVTYWRISDLRDNVMRTVMSRRSNVPEITAEQALEVNQKVAAFDNKISRVFEIRSDEAPSSHAVASGPLFSANTDWMGVVTACGPVSTSP